MRTVIFIYTVKRGNKNRDLVAVSASKRSAVKLILIKLLDDGIIKQKNVAEIRKSLNENDKTENLPVNFETEEKPQNEWFKINEKTTPAKGNRVNSDANKKDV